MAAKVARHNPMSGNPWEGGRFIPEWYRDEYYQIGEHVTTPVYGRAQILSREETNDPEKPKYFYTIQPVTKRERTRRGKKPYFPRTGNPDSTAQSMFESFHGSPSQEVLEFASQEHYHGNLAGLGVLVELKLVTTSGYDVTLTFSDPDSLIASNPRIRGRRLPPLTGADKAYANTLNLEWLKLSNKILRTMPGSPKQKELQEKLKTIPQYITNPSVWDRLKSIGSKSTVYPIPKSRPTPKLTVVASVKGHEIFKTPGGGYVVPGLDRGSEFESLREAKRFVGAWRGNPGGTKISFSSDNLYQVNELLHNPRSTGLRLFPGWYKVVSREESSSPLSKKYRYVLERVKRPNPGPIQSLYGSTTRALSGAGKYLDGQLGRVVGNPVKYVPSESEAQALVDKLRKRGIAASMQYSETKQGKERWKVMYEDSAIVHRPNPTLDPALLCSNESGTQLYIQGGDQGVSLDSIHMGDVPVKDSMVLGECYFISYFTEKDFDQHKALIYEHQLGELADKKQKLIGQGSGIYPTVRYDTLNKKLYLDGGEYKIDQPAFSTSPGIEG